MDAEQKAAIEDGLNGRVIPRWRYWLMYWLILAALLAAHGLPDGFWWAAGPASVVMGAYGALFIQYRRRTIR